MQNINLVSSINYFEFNSITFNLNSGRRAHWYYLIDAKNERMRCFDQDEAVLVRSFLEQVIHTNRFGSQTSCFIKISESKCDNNQCETFIAMGLRPFLLSKLPKRILPNDFERSSISDYKLEFPIIGFLF